MSKRLTEYADCAGCASKLDAALLDALMDGLPVQDDPRILVDYRTSDDAGVYRWAAGPALVQTVDFFTPIVDDPYTFGRIAAANALSDVYAMGGTPRTALAITALPKNGPPADVIREVFRGGADTLREAGVALLGGHTVSDPEVKFGYSVTGEVDPARIWTNSGARPGDVLILTKALGTGVIVRAIKYQKSNEAELQAAVESMTRLNDVAVTLARDLPSEAIHACTDVTGFGLVGHSTEMAVASDATLVIHTEDLPLLPGAADLVAEFLPCGGRANVRHFRSLAVSPAASPARHMLCLDPQTSGGLLLAVSADAADEVAATLRRAGDLAAVIGVVAGRDDESGMRVRLE